MLHGILFKRKINVDEFTKTDFTSFETNELFIKKNCIIYKVSFCAM